MKEQPDNDLAEHLDKLFECVGDNCVPKSKLRAILDSSFYDYRKIREIERLLK